MPGLEIHADYDRDGRLTGSAAERAARLVWPGAIVVANLDRDQRVLPARPSSGGTPPPDYDIATAFSRDDELLPIRIRVASGALGAGERLRIRCSGIMHTRIRLSTSNGVIVPHRLGAPEQFELPPVPPSGVLDLTLQVRTIAGASFGSLSSLEVSYRNDPREESRFELTLVRVDALAREHEEDRGRFSVAPVVLDDRMTQATRLYIVDVGYNRPSLVDVRVAAAAARVPLVEVDRGLTDGDAWVQDQYQHGMMQGARRSRQIILHLPRLRHQTSTASITDNLEDFVNSHFRSRDVALFTDLWDRIISVNTTDGGVLRASFREIRDWVMGGLRMLQVAGRLDRFGTLVNPAWEPIFGDDLVDTLHDLPRFAQTLSEALAAALAEAEAERATLLDGLRTSAAQMVHEVLHEYRYTGSGPSAAVVSTIGGASVSLPAETARRLFLRGGQMHDSANYGGNIESTPPVRGAPLGKIIIGNAPDPDTGAEFVDPDLLRLLAKQKKQPLVEIDTTWLRVGHVDEMMAVVPHARSGFSVVHASSAAAIAILRLAEALYRSGLPVDHPDTSPGPRRPSGVLPRLMTEGSHPVTRLFRGKSWYHRHRPPEPGRVSGSNEPPDIYLRLAHELSGSAGFNVHRIGYVAGEGPDRRYPADITPSEIVFCERDTHGASVNDGIDVELLEPSRAILSDALSTTILPVPVLWDRVWDIDVFRDFYRRIRTSAFSPDIANLQVVNGHLLVPKPYGPRMRRDDAIAVVRQAMEEIGVAGAIRDRVGPRLIARRRMTREVYWVEKVDPATLFSSIGTIRASYGGLRTSNDVKEMFRDSFPGTDDAELERRLIAPNARRFDSSGLLREDFTRLVVADGMVDLFELWTAAVIEGTGATLHFVDTWSYHLGDGQIHCGTNVLRRPRRLGINVWDAPDVEFRAARVLIADGDTAATG